jgi:oligoendopeptidase F
MAPRKLPERNEVAAEHQWDLTSLFDADEKWEALFAETEADLEGYQRFRGRIGESAADLKEAIEFDLAVSRKIERLYTYAHLKSDEDKSKDRYLAMHQRIVGLNTRAAERSSFMTPEIHRIPDPVMEGLLADEELAPYRFFLEKILRTKPHTHEEKIEQILAMSQEMAQTASTAFGQLDNVDMRFGTVSDAEGNEIELSHGNFITFLNSPDRQVREKAFSRYYKTYEDHKHTLAAIFSQSVKKDVFYSRVRNFESCRQAALFPDKVPEAVYDNLIDTVRSNTGPLFSYFRFRREALGVETLHFYDTYVPIVKDIPFSMPYEEAAAAAAKALAPLGEDYTKTLSRGLLGGWVDRYENRGKRSGAYSSGCYDSPPYILLNYEDANINSLYTLVHEAGHSMHSEYSRRHQPYVDHQYTIFVAEVASTFNEILLGDYLLEHYRDNPAMQAYLINREIDNIRATLFRQTMFAEFEKICHHMAEKHEPLTLESLTGVYRELLKVYFGDTMAIDDVLRLECLRIPHFYHAFYVYKYATGISAAIALARQVLEEGQPARDRYLSFLKLGGSMFPLDELRAAGVDMETPAPVEAAIAHFAEKVKQLQAVYAKL